MSENKCECLFGTGEGSDYINKLSGLLTRTGSETHLYRVMCDAEYISIISNNYKFIQYDYAMEQKWFAAYYKHAVAWAVKLYPDNIYKIVEITVLQEALNYMFYVKILDNIGPAYSADALLLNNIVRRVKLV